MIPKIIHLCWFSGDEYPHLVAKCIASWKREMPDYKIRIWTYEDAVATGIPFVVEALKVRKWAFAADVIRLYALYHEGGVYLDSDFYVCRDLTPLLTADFVSAIEGYPEKDDPEAVDAEGRRNPRYTHVESVSIQAAFLAAVPRHPFVKSLLDFYSARPFIQADGTYDMQIIAPFYYALRAEEFGFKYFDRTQELDGMIIWSSRYIAPCDIRQTSDTYGVHICLASWRRDSWGWRMLRKLRDFLKSLR